MAPALTHSEDLRLNYNPRKPQERFLSDLSPQARADTASRVAKEVPWPAGLSPTPVTLNPVPKETDDLSRFAGYDAIVMTYTSAEADTLATLFTKGHPLSTWYEYRHNIAEYIPLVTGSTAPFNSTEPEDARYYHSLGLYFPCTVAGARVLLVKSGLHLDHDLETVAPGSVIPFAKLLAEMMGTVKPKVFITTGTGGAIGNEVKLGDVVIAAKTLFDCRYQFKNEDWAHKFYGTSPLPDRALALMTPELLKVNASAVAAAHPIPGRAQPEIWSGPETTIVTTDIFAFDTSNNQPYQLAGLGQACDMGDAMVGKTLGGLGPISWYAIRNASDPQIPVPPNPPYPTPDQESNSIYASYGAITSAASVIATWAILAATFGG
jgi:hypothetical protein